MGLLGHVRFLPDRSIAGGALPWVIGTMVFLCTLSAGFGFAAHNAIGQWASGFTRQLSVQITAVDKLAREEEAEQARALLSATPGIVSVEQLDDEAVARLLEPWIGAGNLGDTLPVPILLDVQMMKGARLDANALQASLKDVAPSARVDDHDGWLSTIDSLIGSTQFVAFFVVVLIFFATAAIAAFGTRAGLSSHKDSIEIMHLMGAADTLIAGEFRYRFMLQGLKGGIGGFALGSVVIIGLQYFTSKLGEGLLPSMQLGLLAWGFLLILPLFAACLTMVSAHLTVKRELSRIL